MKKKLLSLTWEIFREINFMSKWFCSCKLVGNTVWQASDFGNFWDLKRLENPPFYPFFSYFQKSYGNALGYNKSATNTLRLFYNSEDFDDFFKGFQAKYWEKHGASFVKISAEKCREIVPSLGKLQMQ